MGKALKSRRNEHLVICGLHLPEHLGLMILGINNAVGCPIQNPIHPLAIIHQGQICDGACMVRRLFGYDNTWWILTQTPIIEAQLSLYHGPKFNTPIMHVWHHQLPRPSLTYKTACPRGFREWENIDIWQVGFREEKIAISHMQVLSKSFTSWIQQDPNLARHVGRTRVEQPIFERMMCTF